MSEQEYKIKLLTSNQYSEFYFYASISELEEYLNETLAITPEQFLDCYTLGQSRQFFEWIKAKSNQSNQNEQKVTNKESKEQE
ncbi:hypothetical protein G9G63_09230 [Paenibacillus sp. EKM202P]|uniref:hypothetical protein n=1 Tax=unclassified Paenibacillus TaxID=185978 RepID=UPI0013E9C3E1|nr:MULTISPECIES: hypothetical protein [unclassified Paenibacillus]KAF6565332.1 hypothetical protein G9G63_09230 [Paenibacillus sp. EKM202P]KAF6569342.1 hypothetical protein G9G64_12860 [Paenibacillus sp. EKM207P]